MLTWTFEAGKFTVRAAAVVLHNERVLLHQAEGDDFWALPGGRVEYNEYSHVTVVREMAEEVGHPVTVERLLWVVENMFTYQNLPHHEINLFHLAHFAPASPLYAQTEWYGVEGAKYLLFRWFPLAELPALRVYPEFLRTRLADLPSGCEHICHRDEAA